MRHADERHVSSWAGGADSLYHGLFGADALQHGVGTDAVGHILDARHALFAALAHDLGGAEFARQFCRLSCRLMAMMRWAPICFAESTPSKPTAPSPTTTTVEPGLTFAASAANQPVPSTSDAASKLGSRSSLGLSAVGTSVPSALGTRSTGACARNMNSRFTQ